MPSESEKQDSFKFNWNDYIQVNPAPMAAAPAGPNGIIRESMITFGDTIVYPELPTKYNETEFTKDAITFIRGTYARHYVGDNGDQTIDVWNSLGSAASTCRDTAIKYLMRYGKKDGHNVNDLYKAIHYIALLHYFTLGAGKNDKGLSNKQT